MKKAILTVGTSLLSCAAGAGWSQVPSGESSASDGLDEIVVTAQRRPESAQRAAVAISVVAGGALSETGVYETDQLGKLVPALTVAKVGPSNVTPYRI